jgi:hypothetical protein
LVVTVSTSSLSSTRPAADILGGYELFDSPPIGRTGKLVESDDVLLIHNLLGTAYSSAIQNQLKAKKIPQLFIATGARERWMVMTPINLTHVIKIALRLRF